MSQRFRSFLEGMTIGEQRVLVGLIVIATLGIGIRQYRLRAMDGFHLIAQYDAKSGEWKRVDGASAGAQARIGAAGASVGAASASTVSTAAPKAPRAHTELLDINKASEAQLEALAGIGPAYAGRIVRYRQDHGPFASVDDLDSVPGIGPRTLEALRPCVTVGQAPPASSDGAQKSPALAATPGVMMAAETNSAAGTSPAPGSASAPVQTAVVAPPAVSLAPAVALPPAPRGGKAPALSPTPGPSSAPSASQAAKQIPGLIDVNHATQADLERLPGIGPALAKKIIDYRVAHGPYRRVGNLEKVSGIGPARLSAIAPLVSCQ